MQAKHVNDKILAKPFLKWAGGKKQLLNEIVLRLPSEIKKTGKIDKYFEPFLGGGAVYFYLMNNYKIKEAFLFDINYELILTYDVIKNDSKELINELEVLSEEYLKLEQEDRKDYFYSIRKNFNEQLKSFDFKNYDEEHIERASYMIFLNKTCYNGLFRVNKKGEFNVPFGRYKNPKILDESNILAVSKMLEKTNICCGNYLDSEEFIDENSFVYLDPPYRPLKNNSFTSYSKFIFNDDNQRELCDFYKRISDKGAKSILNNSDPKNVNKEDNFFDELYANFKIERVPAKRYINSDSKGRGSIFELLISNY